MRVVLAFDSFGDLQADRVGEFFRQGWADVSPDDLLLPAPMSDGGPMFAAVLASENPRVGGECVEVSIEGPTGAPADGYLVRHGSTVYVESAMACGLDQLKRHDGDVRTATTFGVGQLIAAAATLDGVDTAVVGLGGSGTNDGGAGLWAALGAEPTELLRGGGVALKALESVTVPTLDVTLIAATDVDNGLLGMAGASNVYGPQKGADQAAIMSLDIALEKWADMVEAAAGKPGLRNQPGAGAAGGMGFGLMALGAERRSGVELVMAAVDLRGKVEGADLVITGEGSFDATSLRGKVAAGVALMAQEAGVPCVVAAGQVSVGAREAASNGIDQVFSVAEELGSVEAALAAGQDGIRELGRAVARAWSRPQREG